METINTQLDTDVINDTDGEEQEPEAMHKWIRDADKLGTTKKAWASVGTWDGLRSTLCLAPLGQSQLVCSTFLIQFPRIQGSRTSFARCGKFRNKDYILTPLDSESCGSNWWWSTRRLNRYNKIGASSRRQKFFYRLRIDKEEQSGSTQPWSGQIEKYVKLFLVNV